MNPYQSPKNLSNESSRSSEVERRWIISFVILSVIYIAGRTHAVLSGDDPNGFSLSDPVMVAAIFWIMMLINVFKNFEVRAKDGTYVGLPFTGWGFIWRTVIVFVICAFTNWKILSYFPGFYEGPDYIKAIGFGVLFFIQSPFFVFILYSKNRRLVVGRLFGFASHT